MPSEATPDFDEEALTSEFLREVSDGLTTEESKRWQAAQESIRSDTSRLAEENAQLAEDPAGVRWIAISSMLLAIYRHLRSSLGDEKRSLDLLRNALTGPLRAQISSYIQLRFGISQDAREEAFRRASENFRSRGQERFGRGFRYVDDVRDDGHVFVNIESCLFNEFFRRNGAPELMVVMCAFDSVWADELNKPEYGVRFERPTTIGQGDDVCRFQFTRTRRH
jgi:hypothetical protein